jgi:hypothetical protein
MNVYDRSIATLNAEWKGATPARREQIQDEVYHLELDKREAYE